MAKFLSVKNLCFGYIKKTLCLKDVSFSAKKYDKILLLGFDDAGKTSLVKCLSGFEEKFFGSVSYSETEIRKISNEEKNVSIIFDEPILLNSTIDDNLNFLYNVLKQTPSLDNEKQELLVKFKINHDLKTKVKKLSLAEKFKLCLLRTYIKNSKAVFIDDILKYDFIDEEKNDLFKLMKFISKDKLIFVTANVNNFKKNKSFYLEFGFDKVLYLNDAKLSKNKTIQDFLASPIDLDACEFNDDFEKIDGYCVYQDASYYLCFDDKWTLKLDKNFNKKFDCLRLADNENEDIVLVYPKGLSVDFEKNNDFNKLLGENKVMIFSKLARNKVL